MELLEKFSDNEFTWDIHRELEHAKMVESTPKEQSYNNLGLTMGDSVEQNKYELDEEKLNDADQENKEIALQLDWWRKSR